MSQPTKTEAVPVEAGRTMCRLTDTHILASFPRHPDPALSSSGKSLVVGTTRGNQPTQSTVDGKSVIVSANAYIPA